MAKLRLGFYPYTYARVSVMKSELIKADDWPRLAKMGANELLRYVQDGNYKKEISELGDQRNIAAIEMALNDNLMRAFEKLKRISDEKVRQVLNVYLKRYDLENFKTIIRGKSAGIEDEEIEQMMLPSVNYKEDYFIELIKKEDVESVINAIDVEFGKGRELFELENDLDRAYYNELLELAQGLAGQGVPLRKFIESELEILNLKILVRLKRENVEDIEEHLINPSSDVLKLLEKELRDIITGIGKLGYTTLKGDESVPESEMVSDLEIDMDTYLLKKEILLMHQYPLTVNVFLGFMFAKEIEVRNLKTLLKGKQLGLEENTINRLLVA